MKYDSIIEVHAKEWRDQVYGNSYFSARVYKDVELVAVIPYQYGYGSSYEDAANDALSKAGIIDNPEKGYNNLRDPLFAYCSKNNIKLIRNKTENCRKPEVIAYGTETK